VETELLDDLPLLHSKTDAHVVIRGVRGRCHVCPLFRYARQLAHMCLLPHCTRRVFRNPTHASLVLENMDKHFNNLERNCHGSHTAKNMTHACQGITMDASQEPQPPKHQAGLMSLSALPGAERRECRDVTQ